MLLLLLLLSGKGAGVWVVQRLGTDLYQRLVHSCVRHSVCGQEQAQAPGESRM